MLRLHTPLFKPDRRFSRIRLSDKESRFRPREMARPPMATLYTGGSDGFVSSTTAPIATGRSDPAAGWDLHPLETAAFARRTKCLI
jgi:hypothetical protein